jgi:hypothetical protein
VFSFVLFGLLVSLAVRAVASLVIRRFTNPPQWVRWIYGVGYIGVWLFALVAVFLISIVIAAIVVVVAAICVLVLGAERRRSKRIGR